ncbi:MAG TPA: DUF4124 domain-containing protein [Zeimonas sp.]|nr:DUF4124 domain-containing protein [Zeimonas sp.]
MPAFRPLSRVLAVAGLLIALPALAGTWQWRDASGRMVYSDLPPPPDVRASQILRAPTPASQPASATAAPDATPASQPRAGASAAVPRTWAEKEQESRKRAAEREEAEKQQREEREQLARTARACQDARAALRTLESGMRMAVLNARGEREAMDEAERSRRIDSARQEIARSCAKGG